MSNLTIRQAIDDITAANKALERTLESVLPVGSSVWWERGGSRQYGLVNRIVTDRVEVTNQDTGKTYLLHAFWFTSDYNGGVA